MFAYCQNNPVLYLDPNGLCREVGPNLTKVLDCAQPDCKSSKYYIENPSIRKAAQTATALVTNINVELGIGLGLYAEVDAIDFLDMSIGIRYDLINIGLSKGEFYCNQSFYTGVDGTLFWVFDFDVHSEDLVRENPFSKEVGLWQDNSSNDIWSAAGVGAYFFGGGRYYIGFDVISFCKDINNIFQ